MGRFFCIAWCLFLASVWVGPLQAECKTSIEKVGIAWEVVCGGACESGIACPSKKFGGMEGCGCGGRAEECSALLSTGASGSFIECTIGAACAQPCFMKQFFEVEPGFVNQVIVCDGGC